MARTIPSTNDITKLRILLENNRDEEAMAVATNLALYTFSGYPIDPGNAMTYLYIAAAFTRSGRPKEKPFAAMKLSAATPERRAILVQKYDQFMHGSEHKVHPFAHCISEATRSFRRLFK
ncbi:hypothetical protein HY312_00925 [Candidatus Saccharibacteria bacterium]|nr:hypothetical protein [Candidatus Saccharibacteria bacterium]